MAQEDLRKAVPRCFIAACDHLLHCKGGDPVRPTVEDMGAALCFAYLLDEVAGQISAIAPDGTVYEFEMSNASDEVRITAHQSHLWLVWFTMQSLAGFIVDNRGLTFPPNYRRSVTNGSITLVLFTYGMNCDEEGPSETPASLEA